MSSGKGYEKQIRRNLLSFYGEDMEVLRLEDSHDAGRIVSKKPSDFVVIFPDGKAAFLEVKERTLSGTAKSLNISKLFEPSQIQAIKKSSRNGKTFYLALKVYKGYSTSEYLLKTEDLLPLVESEKPTPLLELNKWAWSSQTQMLR